MDGVKAASAAARRKGFALVEVLTAGLVLALAVLGLSASIANGSRLADGSREEMLARDAMRDTLAKLAEAPFDTVALNFHTGRFSAGPLRAVDADPDGWPGEIVFSPGPDDSRDVYRVTLRMQWRGAGGERVIENTHYLANVRGDPGVAPSVEDVEQILAAR
jgi:Tfp pilus assembly protein PilV